ncbi:hypothetical protein [Hymenobacter oligotrophus]|uniref:hypothetical protein n=1 Tax=Hymenobacter oligotrophus TaxID=2319843 RepID=UPI0013C31E00|nr:hypothetical protein [Hymenobacter oligotrophus]
MSMLSPVPPFERALKLHAYFSKVFDAFSELPISDIQRTLREQSKRYTGYRGSYYKYRLFLERIRSFVEKRKLDPARRKVVLEFLDYEEPLNQSMIQFPECRHELWERDRADLRMRLYTLSTGEKISLQALAWASSYRPIGDLNQLEKIQIDEDSKQRIAVIIKRLSLLDSWRSKEQVSQMILQIGVPTSPLPGISQQAPIINNNYNTLPPVERILGSGFTLGELTALAHQISLIDEAENFSLDARKKGALVGFCQALQHLGKLQGKLSDLIPTVGQHFNVEVLTRKATTDIARHYYALTKKALNDSGR